jgi:hypothetical protein
MSRSMPVTGLAEADGRPVGEAGRPARRLGVQADEGHLIRLWSEPELGAGVRWSYGGRLTPPRCRRS